MYISILANELDLQTSFIARTCFSFSKTVNTTQKKKRKTRIFYSVALASLSYSIVMQTGIISQRYAIKKPN